ncbi:dihydrodipicolinate synthase family protein [Proteiniphilum acetatigenes]|uniref:dihydrodipicolinate synthase family protein n=1 Tax=Proteiniphilum acetatigenes TaxID=294710 RepID=UPI0003630686|nr:dihydrodipicolinate synthase family protein [Proteiniphilum acetatigenes]SFK58163.1 4-hydroxy-tetrahydrodipicolinate synthase [Porphyromonadaceae bacterium KH3CP3RA]
MQYRQLKPLEGIIVPLVTPLSGNNRIDIEGLNNLVEHVIRGGVHGIFILGTTGEAQSLSMSQREEMIKETSRILGNRLPLLVGISDTSLSDSVALAQKAYEAGAYAVVATPPYYFATAQSELIGYFENLISLLPLPLFLYNMPVHTKVAFDPKTIKQIAQNEKVIGFKDSSANGTYLQTVMYIMRERPEFMIFVGPEEMTAEMVLMGAHGGVNGGANLFPELYVELYNAAKSHNIEKVRSLQQKVMQISTGIYSKGKYGSSYLIGLKCALSVAGICGDFPAMPFTHFNKERRNEIEKEMGEIKKVLGVGN